MAAGNRGFTLLELLVALAIFAVIGTVSFSAVQSGVDTANRLGERRTFWEDLDSAFRILEQDLAMAIARPPRIPGQSGLQAFEGYGRGRPGRQGELMRLTRSGMTSVRQGSVSPYRRVAYRLQEGELYRDSWRRLDVPVREEPQQALLVAGIKDHSIEFWSAEAEDWVDQWPRRMAGEDEAAGKLPGAVRLRMDFGKRGSFERIFPIGPIQTTGTGDGE